MLISLISNLWHAFSQPLAIIHLCDLVSSYSVFIACLLLFGAIITRKGRETNFETMTLRNISYAMLILFDILFCVHDPEDAVVHLAVCLHILPEILAEVARQTGDWDMWVAKNMFRAQTRCHKDIKSRWIKTYKIPFFVLFCFFCIISINSKPPFVSSCRIFSSVIKEQGKEVTVTGLGFKESFVSAQHDFFRITRAVVRVLNKGYLNRI